MRTTLLLLVVPTMLTCSHHANAWSLFGPGNYEDCVLEGMKGISSETAAREVRNACRIKFPAQARPAPKPLELSSKDLGLLRLTLPKWKPVDAHDGLSRIACKYSTLSIYNGSGDLTVNEVTLRLQIKDLGWREYTITKMGGLNVPPLSTQEESLNLEDCVETPQVQVVRATGYRH